MHGEGFNVTLSVTAVDDVSFDSKYMKNKLRGFLGVKTESSHTSANHNANNAG